MQSFIGLTLMVPEIIRGGVPKDPLSGPLTLSSPNKFLNGCAKTVCSRLLKLSDFYYNHIRHHLKWFSVSNNLGCCHGTSENDQNQSM